jgi:hypothetical protein
MFRIIEAVRHHEAQHVAAESRVDGFEQVESE